MKTAFKILPLTPAEESLHLLAEIGSEGLSLLYYSASPTRIEGWMNYQFEKNMPSAEMATELNQLLGNEALPDFNSCHIFFNFKECMLVPDQYFKDNAAASMLDCKYGEQPTDAIFSEPVDGMNAMNVYRVNDYIYNILNSRYLSAVFNHSHTLLIPFLKRQQQDLFCTIYQHSIRVILFRDEKLQLVQYFDYSTPSDVAYHLINTCSQHQVSPSDIQLTLTGFIDRESNLYEELYRYFLNIQIPESGEIALAGEVGEIPAHFFSHLISLVKCVS